MTYDLIIIGAGPSGLTAAVYAARKKIKTLLISKDVGGQVIATGTIENYMGFQVIDGFTLMDKFEAQIKQFPIDKKIGEEVVEVRSLNGGFEVSTAEGEIYQSKTVIVATGKTPRRLNVPGEAELMGRGVSYCAICDGPLFSGENVAVIGGGNSALEAIDDLLKIAVRVYSVTEADYTGDAVLVDRVSANPKLTIYRGYTVKEIKGSGSVESITIQSTPKGSGSVESITIQSTPKDRGSVEAITTQGAPKVSGSVDAVMNQGPPEGALIEFAIKGIFVEVGLTPNSYPVKKIAGLNSSHEIEVTCHSETSVPGLFASGDVTSTPEKQIIIAAGEGAKAALRANQYLQRMG